MARDIRETLRYKIKGEFHIQIGREVRRSTWTEVDSEVALAIWQAVSNGEVWWEVWDKVGNQVRVTIFMAEIELNQAVWEEQVRNSDG